MKRFLLILMAAWVAPAASADLLYGSEVASHTLMLIDPIDGSWTAVGTFDVCTLSGLAYDSGADILYGIAPCTDNIYVIDRETAVATRVGPAGALGVGNANGLAYDPNADVLYATDNNSNTLLTVDRVTGAGTVVAEISGGFSEIEGLGFDARDNVLYGLTQLQRRIVSIDPHNGEARAVSNELPDMVWRGLDFDAERRLVYASAVDIWGDASLFWFDPATREMRLIAELDGASAVQGLACVGDPSADVPAASVECFAAPSHPNPFAVQTTIRFTLREPGRVTLGIYDISGRQVRTLLPGNHLAAGEHAATWDGRDGAGRDLRAGAYFYRLIGPEVSAIGPIRRIR